MNKKQRTLIADIFGNIAVAWFAIGVISPVFIKSGDSYSVAASILMGLGGFGIFFYLALKLLKR